MLESEGMTGKSERLIKLGDRQEVDYDTRRECGGLECCKNWGLGGIDWLEKSVKM